MPREQGSSGASIAQDSKQKEGKTAAGGTVTLTGKDGLPMHRAEIEDGRVMVTMRRRSHGQYRGRHASA